MEQEGSRITAFVLFWRLPLSAAAIDRSRDISRETVGDAAMHTKVTKSLFIHVLPPFSSLHLFPRFSRPRELKCHITLVFSSYTTGPRNSMCFLSLPQEGFSLSGADSMVLKDVLEFEKSDLKLDAAHYVFSPLLAFPRFLISTDDWRKRSATEEFTIGPPRAAVSPSFPPLFFSSYRPFSPPLPLFFIALRTSIDTCISNGHNANGAAPRRQDLSHSPPLFSLPPPPPRARRMWTGGAYECEARDVNVKPHRIPFFFSALLLSPLSEPYKKLKGTM